MLWYVVRLLSGIVRFSVPVLLHYISEAGSEASMSHNFVDDIYVAILLLVLVGFPVHVVLFLAIANGLSLQRRLGIGLAVVRWMKIVLTNLSCEMRKIFLFGPVTVYGSCLQGNNCLYASQLKPSVAERSRSDISGITYSTMRKIGAKWISQS